MKEITQELVRKLFDYDPETGIVTRKKFIKWNAKKGDIVSCRNSRGYIQVYIQGRQFKLHRIIWLWMDGYLPEHGIDHINRDPTDNRWCNLREITQQCNIINRSIQGNNTTGVTGVKKYSKYNKEYTSSIDYNRVRFHLGHFNDFTEAVAHRLAAEQALDWAGCDSNSTAYQYMQNYLKELKNATDINSD